MQKLQVGSETGGDKMKWMTNHVNISCKNENWPTTQRKHKF